MAALGTSETVFWSPYIAQIYAQRVARTHFQTVSVRGSEKFVWWADSFRPLNAYAHALFENAVDHCVMLRCSLANGQKALGNGEALG
jgi:hypothetical protein